jgi:hypothetical protein
MTQDAVSAIASLGRLRAQGAKRKNFDEDNGDHAHPCYALD